MIGKLLGLLAVPLGFIAYSSYAKASPAKSPTFDVKGKSGAAWRVVRVSQFQQPDGLLSMNDVMQGSNRVLRYSQLGSAIGSRKYVTSPFDAGTVKGAAAAKLVRQASQDFGVVLPPALSSKLAAAGA